MPKPWSAFAEKAWGFARLTVNATALHAEFLANGDGVDLGSLRDAPGVRDDLWLLKPRAEPAELV